MKQEAVCNTTCIQAFLQKRTQGTGSMELQIWLMWCHVMSCDVMWCWLTSCCHNQSQLGLAFLTSSTTLWRGRESHGVTSSTSLSGLLCAAPLRMAVATLVHLKLVYYKYQPSILILFTDVLLLTAASTAFNTSGSVTSSPTTSSFYYMWLRSYEGHEVRIGEGYR